MRPLVQLLVSEWCAPCRGAEAVWQDIARRKVIDLRVLDVGQVEGREVVAKLGLRTVPATVIDGELRFVGIPDRRLAHAAVAGAEDRRSDDVQQVGMTLSNTSAWSIVAAVFYLSLAGATLLWSGGLDGDGPVRTAALHGFGLGFATLAIFGFGEHMLPRFMNAPIRAGWLAWFQQALVHAGVLLISTGVAVESRSIATLGGIAASLSFVVFTIRIAPVLLHRSSST